MSIPRAKNCLAKAANYPHICPHSQFGELTWWSRSLQNSNQLFLALIVELSWNSHHSPPIICLAMASFLIGQSAWWSNLIPKSNHLFFTTLDHSIKLQLQSWYNILNNIANRQTNQCFQNLISLVETINKTPLLKYPPCQ